MVACRAFCTCAIVFATLPLARADSQPAVTIHGVTKAVSQALRGEALAADGAEREIILRELIRIHDQALAHSRFAQSSRLQRTVLRIRARLRRVRKEIQQQATENDVVRRAVARQEVLHQRLGNVGQAPQAIANGGAQQGGGDYGQELLDLIERTISPPIWEANGGPATIVYFQPRHALVVRATQDTHRDLGRLLIGLRAAGP